jgi:hypothetical protein
VVVNTQRNSGTQAQTTRAHKIIAGPRNNCCGTGARVASIPRMRPPKARSLSVGVAGALAIASLGALRCSSSDTILALTITSGDGVVAVSKIHVTITPASGSPIEKDFTPPTTDGAIQMSFFERIGLPDSAEGEATVRADALDASNNSYAWGTTPTTIEKNHTVAAHVKLTVGGPPPATDGGADAMGGAGGGGAGGGAGGGPAGADGGAGTGGASAGAGGGAGAGGAAAGAGGHAGGGGRAGGPGAGTGGRGNGNGRAGAGGA